MDDIKKQIIKISQDQKNNDRLYQVSMQNGDERRMNMCLLRECSIQKRLTALENCLLIMKSAEEQYTMSQLKAKTVDTVLQIKKSMPSKHHLKEVDKQFDELCRDEEDTLDDEPPPTLFLSESNRRIFQDSINKRLCDTVFIQEGTEEVETIMRELPVPPKTPIQTPSSIQNPSPGKSKHQKTELAKSLFC
jgi:hypothetical protein